MRREKWKESQRARTHDNSRIRTVHVERQAEKEAKIKKMKVQRLGKCRKAELNAVPSDDEQSTSARLAIA